MLTAFLLLLAGMCYDLNQADSVFACDSSPISATRFLISPDKSPVRVLSTLETLGQRVTVTAAKPSVRAARKSCTKYDAPLISVGTISHNPNTIFRTVSKGMHHEARSNIVIVSYIHMQDGEKI